MSKPIYFLFLIFISSCVELKNESKVSSFVVTEKKLSEKKNFDVEENQNTSEYENTKEIEQEKEQYKQNWSNPYMSPYGQPIINIIRAYFMVGEFQTVKKFIVNSDCFDDDEFEYILRNCSWGYEIDATNMKWQNDSTFLMTAKTLKNQTVGIEQYLGKVVNDTAKIFLFGQNKKNPFIFNKKNPSAEIQCEIESLAKTIDFEYDSSKLTNESKKNLLKIYTLLNKYSNLKFVVNGHTSSEGSDQYNMKLSIDRANSDRSYLLSLGIKASTIKAEGFGSSAPIYTNANLRSMNRRVEIFILNQ